MSEHTQVTSPTLDRSTALEFVVGFDGSPSSRQALELAGLLGDARGGHVSVVYVAHMPAVDTLAASGRRGGPGDPRAGVDRTPQYALRSP